MPLDCLVDQDSACALGDCVQRRAGDLLVVLVSHSVIKIRIGESSIVPKLTNLHAIKNHDIVESSDQKSKGDNLVVDSNSLTERCELTPDLLPGLIRIAHHVVQTL